MTPAINYEYRATVVRVIDGDTVVVDWDLGAGTWKRGEHLRLFGINAPETRGPERPDGLAAKEFLVGLLPVGTEVLIRTVKDKTGKYGRYLATIWVGSLNLNQHLIDNGHAVKADY